MKQDRDILHRSWMELALREAQRALAGGEPPFGAVVVDAEGECLAATTDMVRSQNDWTQHAEVNGIREACRRRGRDLLGCRLVTTVEPCPMCFTAAWLAHVSGVIFGATMSEVARVTEGAQRELVISAEEMNLRSGAPIELYAGVERAQCLEPFHVAALHTKRDAR